MKKYSILIIFLFCVLALFAQNDNKALKISDINGVYQGYLHMLKEGKEDSTLWKIYLSDFVIILSIKVEGVWVRQFALLATRKKFYKTNGNVYYEFGIKGKNDFIESFSFSILSPHFKKLGKFKGLMVMLSAEGGDLLFDMSREGGNPKLLEDISSSTKQPKTASKKSSTQNDSRKSNTKIGSKKPMKTIANKKHTAAHINSLFLEAGSAYTDEDQKRFPMPTTFPTFEGNSYEGDDLFYLLGRHVEDPAVIDFINHYRLKKFGNNRYFKFQGMKSGVWLEFDENRIKSIQLKINGGTYDGNYTGQLPFGVLRTDDKVQVASKLPANSYKYNNKVEFEENGFSGTIQVPKQGKYWYVFIKKGN